MLRDHLNLLTKEKPLLLSKPNRAVGDEGAENGVAKGIVSGR